MKKMNFTLGVLLLLFSITGKNTYAQTQVMSTPQTGTSQFRISRSVPPGTISVPRSFSERKTKTPGISLNDQVKTIASINEKISTVNAIYGCMLYNSEWGITDPTHTEFGMYSFTRNQEDGITKLVEGPYANCGGVYVDGKFYANYVDRLDWGTIVTHNLNVYDTKTWELVNSIGLSKQSNLGLTVDMTYDMTTKTVYAISNMDSPDPVSGSRKAIVTLDLATGTFTPVGYCANLVTLSADGYGQLWAIDSDGFLRTVDKTNGTSSEPLFKCSTYSLNISGSSNPYIQSAEFDYETGKLYWAATTGYEDNAVYIFGDLYEIDVHRQTSTKLYRFSGDAEFSGLYFINKHPDSPGRINDLHFEFSSPGSHDGVIKFHVPETTYDGKELTGTIDLSIRVDGKEIERKENFDPGDLITSKSLSFTDDMIHIISVVPTNEKGGEGPETSVNVYGGKDAPAKVSNLVLAAGMNGESVLTWEAPTIGENGGYIDIASINYKIVRYPDKVTVASNYKGNRFTEKINKDIDLFYYQVISYSDMKEGGYAVSNKLALGNPCSIPYTHTFQNSNCLNVWTILDVNGDFDGTFTGAGWKWDYEYGTLFYYSSQTNAADDWAITPPLNTKPDKVYKLSFITSGESGSYPIKLRVTHGDEPTVEAQKTTVWNKAYACPSNNPGLYTVIFTVKSDKPQYIGFHNHSDAYTDHMYLWYVKLEETGDLHAPDSISNLKIKAAEKGEYKATLTFEAPSKTVGGDNLNEKSTVYIYKNEKVLATLRDVAAGASQEWVDENAAQGWNHYRILAGNSHGTGFYVEDSVFVGQDIPLSVTNLKTVCENETNAIVTWEAPQGNAGVNGRYVDPAKLKYAIYRNVGSASTLVANNLNECKYTDINANTSGYEQAFVEYLVSAVSAEGEGNTARSNSILVGQSVSLPFEENFDGGHVGRAVWLTTDVNYSLWFCYPSGTYPTAQSYNPDSEGLVSFNGRGYPQYSSARFVSPRFNLSEWDNPILSFYVYHVNADSIHFADRIQVEVGADDLPYTAIGDPVLLKADETGWQKHEISLNAYKHYDRISVSFKGINENCNSNIHVDNIKLSGTAYDYELKAVKLAGPEVCTAGVPETYTVTVRNIGLNKNSFRIELYRDDKLIARKTVDNLEPTTTENYGFYYTVPLVEAGDKPHYMYAKIIADKDENESNNTTSVLVQTVKAENYPYIDDLTATTANGRVDLKWSEPSSTPYSNLQTDDVEAYEPFSIANIGKWTVYDGDKAIPFGFGNGQGGYIEWPNYRSPQAYIVFNPTQITIGSSMVSPYSGDQCFISFASTSSAGNDDWLISPPLSQNEQTISFYAKSISPQYTEQFYVLASSTDMDISNFRVISGNTTVQPASAWQEYSYILPEGTKYFAIRYISVDAFGIMLDDLTFEPELEVVDLLGYHVYCNDRKITPEPIGETAFSQTGLDLEHSAYEYRVSAVYEQGESMLSNAVVVGQGTGIESVQTGAPGIFGGDNCIFVDNALNKKVQIYTIDGKLIRIAKGESFMIIPIEKGIYVVKVSDKVSKIIVK